ncbi:MAG: methylamine utilization protein [Bryobacteraceae bacterium]|nr:methylamine utilization protein [Bryobacteraceae bacterium]
MTWRWLISFSLLAVAVQAETVRGVVHLSDSRESDVTRKRDFSGVVVWLVPSEPGETGEAPRSASATMIQKDKRFTPHILAVEVGTSVSFPNYDPIFHNAFSNYDGRVFDLGLYAPGTTRKVVFDRPGIVRVFCNIHSTMSAVIVVSPSPWFATTVETGVFEIKDVPPGDYTLNVFHERATADVLGRLKRNVTVAGSAVDLGVLKVSESGFLPVPHKNKYGADYMPESEGNALYPAPRKRQ